MPFLQISDSVYRQVLSQTQAQYEALLQACEEQRSSLDAALRTDMDQIITSREHVSSKLRGETHTGVYYTHTHTRVHTHMYYTHAYPS